MRLPIRSALATGALLLPWVLGAQTTSTTLQPGNEQVSRVATRGANFLSIGVGARALALAGAYAATANDLSATYWNVAGLADVTLASGFASHEQLYGNSGLTNTSVVGALPVFGGAFGVSFISFTSGEMTRTTEYYPEGGDPAQGETVAWNATSVAIHYARPFTDRLAAGLTIKRADEGIQFAKATYYGADIGVRFRTGIAGSSLGFALTNVGSSGRMSGPAIQRRLTLRDDPLLPVGHPVELELRTERMQLPTAIRFAVQTDLLGGAESILGQRLGAQHSLMVVGDISDAVDTRLMPALAAEYGFMNRVFLRGGGRWLNDERLDQGTGISYTAGAGISVPIAGRRFLFDFAWRNFGELNDNQVISLQFGN